MAEGEDPFAYKDPVLDDNLDNGDDEQEVDTIRPFQPGRLQLPITAERNPNHDARAERAATYLV